MNEERDAVWLTNKCCELHEAAVFLSRGKYEELVAPWRDLLCAVAESRNQTRTLTVLELAREISVYDANCDSSLMWLLSAFYDEALAG